MPIAKLDRVVIAIRGEEAESWLSGLVTNSLDQEINYAALLTPQGKIIADFFIVKSNEGYWIDVATKFAEGLLKRLRLYRLRAQVEFETSPRSVYVLWNGEGEVGLTDPRHPELGTRLITDDIWDVPQEGDRLYDAHRLRLNIVDSQFDFDSESVFPADTKMDLIGGVDFQKGCFVGQEVVSRMKRKTTVRKRMQSFTSSEIGDAFKAGGLILHENRQVGQILHVNPEKICGNYYGMALIRWDRLPEARAELKAGDHLLKLINPERLHMHIRRNDPRDLRAFAELNIQWIKEFHHVEPSDQYMYDHPESYIEGGNSIFAAILDGEVAGVCALKQDDEGLWELTKMAVDRRFQGRGVGQALMDRVEAYARDALGQEWIYLISNKVNAAAIRLYKRCGWRISFEGPHPRYARADIGMEKDL